MSSNFKLHILTPERQFYDGEVTELKTQNAYGHIEILAKHMPLITLLKPSITEFTDETGKNLKAFVSDGIMTVKNDEVTMLCNAAEWPEEIDIRRAEEAKKRAEERLSKREEIDVKRAESALLRALMRLRVKGE